MKKLVIALGVLLLGVMLMAGCSTTPAAAPAPAATEPAAAEPTAVEPTTAPAAQVQEDVTLTFMASQGWIKDAELELANKFEEQTGIHVDYQICLLYTSPSPRD